MTIHLEITPYWIEFACHCMGIVCALFSGLLLSGSGTVHESPIAQTALLIASIIFITIGAHQ